ncbi:hypothetical protein AK830_g2858 [Neonectria ditissima]|uniref:WSC domain-containing protein n=1 Tax=Neonectria ditissima TaxID=78410 RepID=A0A0N8H864_9HYPO|nr:hypothetical protein AK830_g2858 [Neonectria ditissima]
MTATLLIAILGSAGAQAQASCGSSPLTYWGCAKVDPTGFGASIRFPPGQLTPEAFQAAYAGQMFAALSHDTCRCGNDPKAILSIDESSCDYPCSEEPSSPKCGGHFRDETPAISNVFVISSGLRPGQDQTTKIHFSKGSPTLPSEVPTPSAIQTTTTNYQVSAVESPQEPPDSSVPERSVPEVPVPPASTLQSPPELSVTDSLRLPTPSTPPSSGPNNEAPPPIEQPPISIPTFTASSFPSPTTTIWVTPLDLSNAQTPPNTNPTLPGRAYPTEPSSAGDFWSEPSVTTNTSDDPPVLVIASDSTHFELPVLAVLGKLLLAAAMAI